MRLNPTASSYEALLNWCQAPFPVPFVTTGAPAREDQSVYLSTGDSTGGRLYALNAANGTTRWCQHVKLVSVREVVYPPMMSVPPPPQVHFAAPRVVNDVVYICVGSFGEYNYTCAFNADDGSLRWHTTTDGKVAAMPFMDWAVPLVREGSDGKDPVVYSGTYARDARDGSVLWRAAVDTDAEGALALHALVDKTIFATTQRGIYAINAQDGQIRWLYQPDGETIVSGPPVVADHLLYAGTSGSVAYPRRSYFFALDAATGSEVWRHRIGRYIGAVVHHESIYLSSGDRSLSALETKNGTLRWRYQFVAPAQYPATIADDVLYINIGTDAAYALRSEDGAVLWRQPLVSNPNGSFTFSPSVVLGGAVYLVRSDKRGKGLLYALDRRTGAECWRWQTSPPSAIAPLAVAQ